MKNQTPSKLQIYLSNLDNLTQSTLSFFFNSNLCQKAELKNSDEGVNIYIIDLDRKFDKKIFTDLAKKNQYAIFLHNQNNTPTLKENTYNVSKPVQVKYLKQQIDFIAIRLQESKTKNSSIKSATQKNIKKSIKNELTSVSEIQQPNNKPKQIQPPIQKNHLDMALKKTTESDIINQYRAHKHVGSNKDIDPKNPEELKKIYHTPQKYLYSHIVKAVKLGKQNKSDTLIKTLFGSLLFEYKSQLIYHQFNGTKMRYFKSSPLFFETKVSLIKFSKDAKQIKTTTQNAQELIWESAILASKGKLPQGTSLTQAVEMTSWPNYSRLLVFRYVVQISAAWSGNHMSLQDTATQLNIPQRYIFTLYNAMLAINSAKINNVINNVSKIKNDKRKSVFSRILSHMFNN